MTRLPQQRRPDAETGRVGGNSPCLSAVCRSSWTSGQIRGDHGKAPRGGQGVTPANVSVHRETIIRASLSRFRGPLGSNEINGSNECWTRTVTNDPDAPTVAGVVVTVTLKGARLWTYVCTSAWPAGDRLVLPWTDAHRAPSCARSETMLYRQTPIPNMMVPKMVMKKIVDASENSTRLCPRSSPMRRRRPAPGKCEFAASIPVIGLIGA